MRIEYQDRIDDYLMNRIPEEERRAFEKQVADNAELREQLLFTSEVQRVMKSRNEKLAKMREWKYDFDIETVTAAAVHRPAARSRHLLYWASGIAAVFVIGFFLMRKLYVAEDYSDSYCSPEICYAPADDMIEGITDDESDYDKIEQLICQKSYYNAQDLILEKYQNLMSDSMQLSVLAQSKVIDEKQEEIYTLNITHKQDKLIWLRVQALLGLHQQAAALKLLDELRKKEGDYQQIADSLFLEILKENDRNPCE